MTKLAPGSESKEHGVYSWLHPLLPLLPESGTINIKGGNVTVDQDQQVEFQCVVAAWFPTPVVSWTRNGQAVDSSLYNSTSVAHGDYFNSTSVLKFTAVSDAKVECLATVPALTNPLSSSVFLVVGKRKSSTTLHMHGTNPLHQLICSRALPNLISGVYSDLKPN